MVEKRSTTYVTRGDGPKLDAIVIMYRSPDKNHRFSDGKIQWSPFQQGVDKQSGTGDFIRLEGRSAQGP